MKFNILMMIIISAITMANTTSKEDKTYLKDLLTENARQSSVNTQQHQFVQQQTVQGCQLKPVGMSLKIKDCGRVLFNATKCHGMCESREIFIPYKRLLKTTSSTCKAVAFEKVKREVKCQDNSKRILDIKIISECSCVISERTLQMNRTV